MNFELSVVLLEDFVYHTLGGQKLDVVLEIMIGGTLLSKVHGVAKSIVIYVSGADQLLVPGIVTAPNVFALSNGSTPEVKPGGKPTVDTSLPKREGKHRHVTTINTGPNETPYLTERKSR